MKNYENYWNKKYDKILHTGLTARPISADDVGHLSDDADDEGYDIYSKIGKDEEFIFGETVITYKRINYTIKNYELTRDDFVSMLIDQDCCCKICGKSWNSCKTGLHVDHNHETGKVRGLLCSRCNTSIGKFGDSSELLRKAADYLDETEE